MKRIAIIDDHKLFSAGLQLLIDNLDTVAETEVFDQPRTFLTAIKGAGTCHDLVILDFYIPGYVAVDIIVDVKQKYPAARVMVISASISPADCRVALDAGADIFLHKHAAPERFFESITALLCGACPVLKGDATTALAASMDLTPRQLDTLVLASKGLSNKEIGRMLDISPETVKSHLSDIYLRFSVSNRMEAIEHARANGLC